MRVRGLFVVQACASLLSFVVHLVLVKTTGIEAYGMYALAMAVVLPATLVARRGWEIGIISYVIASGPDVGARRLRLTHALRQMLPWILTVCAAAGALAAVLMRIDGPAKTIWSAVGASFVCLAIAIGGLLAVGRYSVNGALVGYASDGILRPLLFSAALISFAAFGAPGVSSVLVLHGAAGVLAVVAGMSIGGIVRGPAGLDSAAGSDFAATNQRSVIVMWGSLAYQVLLQVDVLAAGLALAPAVAGTYAFVKQLALLGVFLATVGISAVGPKLGEAIRAKNAVEAQRLADVVTVLGGLGGVVVLTALAVGLAFFSDFFKLDVANVGTAPLLLAATVAFAASCAPNALVLNLAGLQGVVWKIYVMAVLAFVVVTAVLRDGGPVAIAAAYALAVLALNVSLCIVAYRCTGIVTWIRPAAISRSIARLSARIAG